jgi:nicotinamide riboside kinase
MQLGKPGRVIALLGAPGTGKSALSRGLSRALRDASRRVAVVPEHRREFCDRLRRAPHPGEQRAIAIEQTRRIELAAGRHHVVLADTTALMTAVYSEHDFGDASLHDPARGDHARCMLTLVMGLDLPWRGDAWRRDGALRREALDQRLRAALDRAALPYATIYGCGAQRLDAALAAVRRALAEPACPSEADEARDAGVPWRAHCERCGDARCERLSLARG